MDAAEDLSGQVDPVCAAFADAVEDRTPGAVDAGQAKDAHVAAQRRPSRISRVAIGAAALDRRAFIDPRAARVAIDAGRRSEEHTSELQSLMRISYAVFCLKKNTN